MYIFILEWYYFFLKHCFEISFPFMLEIFCLLD